MGRWNNLGEIGLGLALLFVGMIANGILARVALLSHRGGFLLRQEASKPIMVVVLELAGAAVGIAAFVLSFFLFAWWWPLIALAIGYWFVAPVVVTRESFALFYQTQFLTALIGLGCSAGICAMFFGII